MGRLNEDKQATMIKKLGDINVNIGDNNTIGHVGHIIHASMETRWILSGDLRNYIHAQVPKNKLAVVWFTSGNEGSLQVARQIYQFMKASGFQLFGDGPAAQIYLTPVYDVVVSPGEVATNVNVGLPTKSSQKTETT